MHYYQLNIADYRKDTTHLTPIEHYIYRTLIDWYYLDESPIPKETQSVMRRLRLGTEEEAGLLRNVLSDFFVETERGWEHQRIELEIAEYYKKCQKNKENGKKGGRPKSTPEPEKTQSVILVNPNESESNPNQEPLTNNHKPVLKEKNIKKENRDSFRENLSDVTDQTYSDFKKLRLAKKAPLTERAIAAIRDEAAKAGINLETALIECCARGWTGFKAEWYQKTSVPMQRGSPVVPIDRSEYNRQQTRIAKEKLFGSSEAPREKDVTNG